MLHGHVYLLGLSGARNQHNPAQISADKKPYYKAQEQLILHGTTEDSTSPCLRTCLGNNLRRVTRMQLAPERTNELIPQLRYRRAASAFVLRRLGDTGNVRVLLKELT